MKDAYEDIKSVVCFFCKFTLSVFTLILGVYAFFMLLIGFASVIMVPRFESFMIFLWPVLGIAGLAARKKYYEREGSRWLIILGLFCGILAAIPLLDLFLLLSLRIFSDLPSLMAASPGPSFFGVFYATVFVVTPTILFFDAVRIILNLFRAGLVHEDSRY